MGDILKRKDNTSIFCPQLLSRHHVTSKKMRVTEFIIAFTLMVVGVWIMILAI